MLAVVPFLAYVTLVLTSPASVEADCKISIVYPRGDLHEPQPLILTRNKTNIDFLYPDNNNGVLEIAAGDVIHLACPGKNNYLKDENWGNQVNATCRRDKLFYVNGNTHDFSSLVCAKDPGDSTESTTSSNFGCKHTPVQIGFNVGNKFISTIEICRDDQKYMTHFAKFHLTKYIGSSQKSYPRPKFKAGTFYRGVTVDNLYQLESQKETLTNILGSSSLVEGKLQKAVQFLARGHLAAKSDFVYGSQQKSTFWFLNAAPQWQSFNDGNWKLLEISVRDLASRRGLDLEVYSGVHDTMTMEDVNGIEQYIYLDPARQIVPVPKYFWKIVYDPKLKKGTALVGLNDPFVPAITKDLYICPNITNQITWLNWYPNNITAGISYACSVDALRRRVPEIPYFRVTGLLK